MPQCASSPSVQVCFGLPSICLALTAAACRRVWHASVPIGRLRRYVTGDYRRRSRLSAPCREYVRGVVEGRQGTDIGTIPLRVREVWSWGGTASL